MIMTLTGSVTPSQIRPMSASFCQPGNEETGRASGRVSLGPLQSFAYSLCGVAALAEEQVRPRVNEENHSLLFGSLANG